MNTIEITRKISSVDQRLRRIERVFGLPTQKTKQDDQQESLKRLYGIRRANPITKTQLNRLRKQLWGS
ncbi:MAG: hypothetical protein WC654_05795 [Patescibacteria group bacterium]